MERIVLDWETGEQTVVQVTAEELAEHQAACAADNQTMRKQEIEARLVQIDKDSARPMRAILSNTATDFDRSKLASLEAEASNLRDELKTL